MATLRRTNSDPLRLLGYARVSTAEQGRSGLGSEAQAAAIRGAAERDGFEVVEIIEEQASGKDMSRPLLLAALERVVRGEVDGLCVAKLDRLTRSISDFAMTLEWFHEAGAVLVALDMQLDTRTPSGKLVASIMASLGEWERETIAARTSSALQAKRERGQAISRPSTLDRPELARRIADMRDEGRTYQSIADTLNREGIATLRGGSEWRVSSVQAATGYRRPPARHRTTDLPAIPRRRRASR